MTSVYLATDAAAMLAPTGCLVDEQECPVEAPVMAIPKTVVRASAGIPS